MTKSVHKISKQQPNPSGCPLFTFEQKTCLLVLAIVDIILDSDMRAIGQFDGGDQR